MLMDNAAAGAVSPDGSRIAYHAVPNFDSELWLIGSDGANPRKIAAVETSGEPQGSQIGPVVWSPSGQRIAYVESHVGAFYPPQDSSSLLLTRDANGGDLQVILKDDARLEQALCWAANGHILYAYREDPTSERGDQGVYSILVDERSGKATGQPQTITPPRPGPHRRS
jgi:Tol biopolymer transport system component